MKSPFSCQILIPEKLRGNPHFQIPDGIERELKLEYYKDTSSMILDTFQDIQLVLIQEEEFEGWSHLEIPPRLTSG